MDQYNEGPLLDEERQSLVPKDFDDAHKEDTVHQGYPPFFAYCFTINFILGAGVLGVPFAFNEGGPVLGAIIMLLVTIVASTTLSWLVEVQARAEPVQKLLNMNRIDDGLPVLDTNFVIGRRKFEINELSQIFLGRWGKIFWEISLFGYSYGALWLYATVFASTLVSVFKIPHLGKGYDCTKDFPESFDDPCFDGYIMFLGVFALIMVPLSFKDLAGQAKLQAGMTIYGAVAIVIMVITVAIGLGTEGHYHPSATEPAFERPKMIDFTGFGKLFTAVLFSQVGHMGAPGLTHLLKDKTKARNTFVAALSTTGSLYIVLGFVCAFFFGNAIQSIATLNWVHYTGDKLVGGTAWWAYILRYTVVIWPAVSVSATYALYAITLGNNVLKTVAPLVSKEKQKLVKVVCRLFSSLPPIILAAVMRDASQIITYSGLFGFSIGFIYPAVLLYKSRQKCLKIWGPRAYYTPYTWFMMHPFPWALINIFWVGSLGYSLYQIFV